ncbi:bifunctional lysylphosphatidylglycerol synthetase/lysine--tRNA ligase LysX [Nakamurella sp. A5-74]|uniref:Bifunctional lysylphosphatidylglycerol synthetase/lysine--tRNA ligase LysX n=1 Tax=Nakamurella sp. A5-74 TaxID=3158264 RepID=A0AAU8DKI3_9ACTN
MTTPRSTATASPSSSVPARPASPPDDGRRADRRSDADVDRRHQRVARIVTACYALAVVVAACLWIRGLLHGRREAWLEDGFGLFNVPLTPSLISVVVLALCTWTLSGRKRVGLVAVMVFQVLGSYLGAVGCLRLINAPTLDTLYARSDFGSIVDGLSVVVGVVVLAVLWSVRSAFPGKLRRGSWRGSLLVLLIGSIATVATASIVVFAHLPTAGPRWANLRATLWGALGFHGPSLRLEQAGMPGWIQQATSLLLSLVTVVAVVVFLRSAQHDQQWTADREVQIRRLLSTWGDRDSLGYFATRRDKASICSPNARAAVTYRVIAGVSLASGDPIGDPESWDAAVAAWRAEAITYGWIPAVLGAGAEGARAYARLGLHVIALGDEALLDPEQFDLDSTDSAPVRQAVNRVRKAGLTIRAIRQGQLAAVELAELAARAAEWRGDEPERGFSMSLGREGDPADADVLFVTARDAGGRLRGLLSFVPWGKARISLDLMRRHPHAPNGINEAMVAHVLTHADRIGVRQVSLNFCMFRGVYERNAQLGSRPLTRLNHSVLGFLDKFWQLERLYRSNEKYHPQWLPRFVCFPDWVSLSQVALAAGMAEGFVPAIGAARRAAAGGHLDAQHLREIEQLQSSAPLTSERGRGERFRQRLLHLSQLEALGVQGYPAGPVRQTCTMAQLAATLRPGVEEQDESYAETVIGRVRAIRAHGDVGFLDLGDGTSTVQVVVDAAVVGSESVRQIARLLDVGDLLRVSGVRGRSRSGQPSLILQDWSVQAKALSPVAFRGLVDPGLRSRRRALDLLVHPESLELLRRRSAVVASLRSTLIAAGYWEVETPILQTVHGGAAARPFRTHINAYSADLSLRIAPELYLKRLLVAGAGPIFEIGRNFRNEGADFTHNPEFTSLEAYLPYSDYRGMQVLAEELIRRAGAAIGVSLPDHWPVVRVLDAVSVAVGEPVDIDTDIDLLLAIAVRHAVPVGTGSGPGAVIEALYAKLVEPTTIAPTFYVDFPAETSPLTRPHRSEPGLVERWDLVMNGMELGTAYTELTDPLEQRRRLVAQSAKATAGDLEAMQVDEDFLADLELGMPPSGGLGIGVDRLVMALTGTTIRSVLSFPFVRATPTHAGSAQRRGN